jgi:septum formation protein
MESDAASRPELVLASASPRRAELLRQLGVAFRVAATDVNEEAVARGLRTPGGIALARARAKAAAALPAWPQAAVLGADTVVWCRGRSLGKPADAARAAEMLRFLSGRRHTVATAVVLLCRGDVATAVEYAAVTFRRLDASEIERYAALAEPLDKAGGYAIQGVAAAFVRRIEGEYGTVVGLPLCRVCLLLRAIGFRIPAPA